MHCSLLPRRHSAIMSEVIDKVTEESATVKKQNVAISVKELSKTYKVYSRPRDRAIELATFNRLVRHREFRALRDVSFDVAKGEALGIVGRNGAGKSTLLQIIAGTLLPSRGSVTINGRVSALLELGSGFNLNFTGRENLYLNAAILGLARDEIEERVDSIINFADIGDFIDQPVKTYSSGMQLRLAFSVQASIDPEILIVDEALAVGDSPFQAKCYQRLRELLDAGTTVIIVTHSNEVIRSFCTTAIWLLDGKMEAYGPAKRVSDSYLKYCMDATGINTGERTVDMDQELTFLDLVNTKNISDKASFSKLADQDRMGTGVVRIDNFFISDNEGKKIKTLFHDKPIFAVYMVKANEDIDEEIEVGFTVKDLHGNRVISADDFNTVKKLKLCSGQSAKIVMQTELPIAAGRYYVSISIWKFSKGKNVKNGKLDMSESEIYDLIYYAYFFEMLPKKPIPLNGPVHANASIRIILEK